MAGTGYSPNPIPLPFLSNASRSESPRSSPLRGSCGSGVLRDPGLVNVDLGVFRKFNVTERVSLQFRGEAFNVSNTPHFANPNWDVASSNFGLIGGVQNTGREGNDQRFFRLGLRASS